MPSCSSTGEASARPPARPICGQCGSSRARCPVNPASSGASGGGPDRWAASSASANGRCGTVLAPGTARPNSTAAPRAVAARITSRASRDLPAPAAPTSTSTPPRPCAAPSTRARSRSLSASRPTSSGHTSENAGRGWSASGPAGSGTCATSWRVFGRRKSAFPFERVRSTSSNTTSAATPAADQLWSAVCLLGYTVGESADSRHPLRADLTGGTDVTLDEGGRVRRRVPLPRLDPNLT